MILEGLVTTVNDDGGVRIAPMGPMVDNDMSRFVLRPYQTSGTFRNLQRTREGVLHVTDDVELLARAAVDEFDQPPRMTPCEAVHGWILLDACRWYAFRVDSLEASDERSRMECRVVDAARLRDFFGFNRAKHAVVEAAILSTRLQLLEPSAVEDEFRRLAPLVEKTGDDAERRAFALLTGYMRAQLSYSRPPASSPPPDSERQERP